MGEEVKSGYEQLAGSDSGEKRKFFSVLEEKKSQAAATGGTSPTISVQQARKIEIQLWRSSELQVPVAGAVFRDGGDFGGEEEESQPPELQAFFFVCTEKTTQRNKEFCKKGFWNSQIRALIQCGASGFGGLEFFLEFFRRSKSTARKTETGAFFAQWLKWGEIWCGVRNWNSQGLAIFR
ncbi:hypothetical protein U1Q18_041732 [Sarracenia purpurea var. burkii]